MSVRVLKRLRLSLCSFDSTAVADLVLSAFNETDGEALVWRDAPQRERGHDRYHSTFLSFRTPRGRLGFCISRAFDKFSHLSLSWLRTIRFNPDQVKGLVGPLATNASLLLPFSAVIKQQCQSGPPSQNWPPVYIGGNMGEVEKRRPPTTPPPV